MKIELRDYQKEAIVKMKNGCILCGGVGSGKSITSLAYYYICHLDQEKRDKILEAESFEVEELEKPKDLYIITTPKKRDSLEWNWDMMSFGLSAKDEFKVQKNKVVVDSWNNIKKYAEVKDAFFIFDEQRVVGWGAWSKTFVKIAKQNKWILLSATPGDKYEDYIPVFIANGFYRNKTEFIRNHIVYDYRVSFPKVERYLETRRLDRLKFNIQINMNYTPPAVQNHMDIWVEYDSELYKATTKNRFNVYTDEPIKNASEFCYTLRRIVNEDTSRANAVMDIFSDHEKVIIFYNFDYELEILKNIMYVTKDGDIAEVAEWNGHKHQQIPCSDSWVYLVQYNSGNEGWNCIETDTIIFYSENYSYRMMTQAAGRIDRMNTPYQQLYYYHLRSRSGIDLAIHKALVAKKKFNETRFTKDMDFDKKA